MARKVNLEDPGPPLTLEEISAFEDEIGGWLPDDYKQLLLAHNGGLVEPPLGLVWQGKIEEVGGFNELSSIPDCGLWLSLGRLRDLNADGLLPVASFLAIRNCSFVTLLDNGTYLESGNGAPMGHKREGAYQQRAFFGLSPQRLFERHLAEPRKLEQQQQQGASALVLREESLQSVTLYGLKLLYEDMVRRGIVQSNPYAELDLRTLAERIDTEEATELPEDASALVKSDRV